MGKVMICEGCNPSHDLGPQNDLESMSGQTITLISLMSGWIDEQEEELSLAWK